MIDEGRGNNTKTHHHPTAPPETLRTLRIGREWREFVEDGIFRIVLMYDMVWYVYTIHA